MQRFIKWFAPIVAIGVAIFITYFLISINSDTVVVDDEPLSYQETTKQENKQKNWLDHFSKSKKLGYFYPVNEIYLKVDLNEKITKTITYKLTANIQDPYQLFCLKEELENYKMKYFLKKDKYGVDLFIYSRNVNKLNDLVKVLKNYKINAQVEHYKEDY